jgi:two-component system cell cycle response regulator
VSRTRTPYPPPPPVAPVRETSTGPRPVGSNGSSVELPAFEEFASSEHTDVLASLPTTVYAEESTEERQFILRVLTGTQTGLTLVVDKDEIVLGRGQGCDFTLDDSALSRRHCRILRADGGLLLEDLGSSNGTMIDGQPVVGRQPVNEGSHIQIGRHTVLGVARQDPLEHSATRRLYEFSMRDPLTGIHNRRYFDQRLQEEFSYALRHRTPVSVLIADLDFFKRINDTWGHPAGDRVLRHASEIFQNCVRKEDVVARYGGEEFAMLARIQQPDGAMALGERVRRRVDRGALAHEGQVINLTVSVGIATAWPDRGYDSVSSLLGAADSALYQAKAGGRNRCVEAQGPVRRG